MNEFMNYRYCIQYFATANAYAWPCGAHWLLINRKTLHSGKYFVNFTRTVFFLLLTKQVEMEQAMGVNADETRITLNIYLFSFSMSFGRLKHSRNSQQQKMDWFPNSEMLKCFNIVN